jgi:hypothetical protein
LSRVHERASGDDVHRSFGQCGIDRGQTPADRWVDDPVLVALPTNLQVRRDSHIASISRDPKAAQRTRPGFRWKSGGNAALLCDCSLRLEAAFRVRILIRLPFLIYLPGQKETTKMGTKSIVGTWVGILAFMAIMLGGLEHASRTDRSSVHAAHVAVRGIVIPPFN